MEHSKHYLIRALAVVMGIFMVGIAVGLFKLAEMGAEFPGMDALKDACSGEVET